jgi:hypothetical protein
MKTCPICARRGDEGSHWACLQRLWAAQERVLKEYQDMKRRVRGELGSEPQLRLEALAAYAAALRRTHKGNDTIGEICDQIELRAWGPSLGDRPFTVPGDPRG